MMNTTETVPPVPKDVETSLPDGHRVQKDDARMEACGTIDELNSFIGLLITEASGTAEEELHQIQRKLFAVGAFAVGVEHCAGLPQEDDVQELCQHIADMKRTVGPLHTFVLPGGTRAAALAHVCRTVCRRAERCAVRLKAYEIVPYLNRLSTFFFYLALYFNKINNKAEIKL